MSKFLFVVLISLISLIASAQETDKEESAQKIHIFDAPKARTAVQPSYPATAARAGKEGYIVYNFMVAEDGTMYEPVVVESVGPASLERAAFRALEKIEWEPAKLDGEPVEGGHYYKFTFQMRDQGARGSFVRKYKELNKYFSNNEYEQASSILDEMRQLTDLNFYEVAYLNVAEFHMARRSNDREAQLESLKSALMYENKGKEVNYLPSEMVAPLRAERFKLEVDQQLYAEALETYELIKKSDDVKASAAFAPIVDRILEIKHNQEMYAVSGILPESGLWFLDLFKQAFYVDQVEGQIDEIKLRCQAKYVFFRHSEDAQYNIPDSWGACHAEVVGTPDTKFRLVQLASEV